MLTSATLAMFIVEALKKLAQSISGDPFYEFHPKLLAALIVVANALSVLALALLDVEGYEIPTDWVGWAKQLLLAILGAVVSSGLYVIGLKPFKAFANEYYTRMKARNL